jgi:hypothetical protein
MSPENTRVWRKTRRQALRGVATGRRVTHAVQTTYGRHQRDAEHRARWTALRAAEVAVLTKWITCSPEVAP